MKKSCKGCRAAIAFSSGCSLGFKTEVLEYGKNNYPNTLKPIEDCPKPLNYNLFSYLLKNGKNSN